MNQIEQTFIDTIQSPVGKLILTVLAIGIGLLLLTFIGPLIGVIVIGILVYLFLHYVAKKV